MLSLCSSWIVTLSFKVILTDLQRRKWALQNFVSDLNCWEYILYCYNTLWLWLLYSLRYRCFYGQMDSRTDRQTNRWTEKQEDERTDEFADGRMDRQIWLNVLFLLIFNRIYWVLLPAKRITHSVKTLLNQWPQNKTISWSCATQEGLCQILVSPDSK